MQTASNKILQFFRYRFAVRKGDDSFFDFSSQLQLCFSTERYITK